LKSIRVVPGMPKLGLIKKLPPSKRLKNGIPTLMNNAWNTIISCIRSGEFGYAKLETGQQLRIIVKWDGVLLRDDYTASGINVFITNKDFDALNA
jgi:hypothetical protein